MKASQKALTILLAALAGVTTSASATTPSLKVGDPAPKIVSGKFIQGDAVTKFEPGKAYIVEFWATWCPPCRASIPHLNDIHVKYKDKGLVVIGQDCAERDESSVEPFVKQMGDKMTYRVALDDRAGSEHGKMVDTWMEAAGIQGIPTAFLVNTNGVIAWIGSPMELADKQDIVDRVLAGTYDIKKAAADYAEELKADEDLEKVKEPLQEKMGAVAQAIRAQKWDEAAANLDAAQKIVPPGALKQMKVNFQVTRWRILVGKKDYIAGDDLVANLADEQDKNAGLLNFLAHQMINDKDNPKPNLDLAEKLAERANKAADGKDSSILDTQARIMFMKGQKDAAISTESKAITLADDEDEKTAFQKNLDSYKSGKLPGKE